MQFSSLLSICKDFLQTTQLFNCIPDAVALFIQPLLFLTPCHGEDQQHDPAITWLLLGGLYLLSWGPAVAKSSQLASSKFFLLYKAKGLLPHSKEKSSFDFWEGLTCFPWAEQTFILQYFDGDVLNSLDSISNAIIFKLSLKLQS